MQLTIIIDTDIDITKDEEFTIIEHIGNMIASNPNRKNVHVWFDEDSITSDEWADFAHFIASESTHNISSYPEDGVFYRCPYSTMERSIDAFRCYQRIVKEGTYDWNQLKALRDVDCSDDGNYYSGQNEEQGNPEPDYDYEPEYTENDYYETESDNENTLTSDEEAELEESDKFFEKLGLLD